MIDGPLPKGQLLNAIEELERLIDRVVPRAFVFDGPLTWHLIATAFLARLADQLRSLAILVEHDQYADGLLVVRTIYQHAVMFCWIAADPDTRMGKWVEHSDRSQRTTLQEALERFEVPVPEDVDTSAEELGRLLPLQQLAREADRHWSERLRAFRPEAKGSAGLLTFYGMYTGLYRVLSRSAHAEAEAIDSVMHVRPTQVVVSRERGGHPRSSALGLSLPLAGLVLVVYDSFFGGFDAGHIRELTHSLHPEAEPL